MNNASCIYSEDDLEFLRSMVKAGPVDVRTLDERDIESAFFCLHRGHLKTDEGLGICYLEITPEGLKAAR